MRDSQARDYSERVNSQRPDQTAQSTNPADTLINTGTAAPPVDTSPAAHPRNFGSDNWAGIHPEVLNAIAEANVGHTPGYERTASSPPRSSKVRSSAAVTSTTRSRWR
jgi:hypothetical protein